MSTDTGPSVENLLGMARTAEAATNNAEALNYYNRVLEIEPRNPEAWLGKGKAAAWQSNLRNLRLNEMVVAFGHAIGSASETDRDDIARIAVVHANTIINATHAMARKHLLQFVTVDNVWGDYLHQVEQMIAALQEARKWQPDSRPTLEAIVALCSDNIQGVAYHAGLPARHSISEQYEKELTTLRDDAAARLREIDPGYAPPAIVKAKSDCFVVTATMGNGDHPKVRLLRRYRDTRLRRSMAGRALMRGYALVGPIAAAVIRDRPLLRALSYRCLVVPAGVLAARRMRDRGLDSFQQTGSPRVLGGKSNGRTI